MDTINSLLAFAAGIFLLWLLFKLLAFPLKILWKLLLNAVLGAVMLLLFNLLGGVIGFVIPITPWSALCAGVLGIPGVIILIVLYLFIL